MKNQATGSAELQVLPTPDHVPTPKAPKEAGITSTPGGAAIQFGRRYRQLLRIWNNEGGCGIVNRFRRVAAERIAPRSAVLPVRREDIMTANLGRMSLPDTPRIIPGEPLSANWVMTPPSPGSGGHTTLFRIIHYLERHGYKNRVYFYDVYGGDHSYYESIVRNYYRFSGPIASVDGGMADAHIVMATGWPTAYSVFNSRCAGKRFYFVQDFEPYFYPAGGISALAESTYRMGFHGIRIGTAFTERLRTEFGMSVDTFKFACDTSQYYPSQVGKRSGIAFYARRENARRGLELGLMTLQVFSARRPDVDIHIFGDTLGKQPFRFIDHGRITPQQINEIYNLSYAGLSLSFTNVSLAPLEMLAAGCIPVVNDMSHVRADLGSPFVRYAPAYPQALAAQLEEVVATEDFDSYSSRAATSVNSSTWEEAGNSVDAILRRALKAAASPPVHGTAMT